MQPGNVLPPLAAIPPVPPSSQGLGSNTPTGGTPPGGYAGGGTPAMVPPTGGPPGGVIPTPPTGPGGAGGAGGPGGAGPLLPPEDHTTLAVPRRLHGVIISVLVVMEILLAWRLVLELLAANSHAPFSFVLYAITYPMIAFFVGVFQNPQAGNNVFDTATVLAMFFYLFVAIGVGKLAGNNEDEEEI